MEGGAADLAALAALGVALAGLAAPRLHLGLVEAKGAAQATGEVQAMATVAVLGRTLTLTLTPTRALSAALGRALSLSLGRGLSLSVGRARTCADRWRGT